MWVLPLLQIDPQHMGVGMYQHDISQKKLQSALEEIVTECVRYARIYKIIHNLIHCQ